MFTQSIKFYTFDFHIVRVQMFEKGDLSNREKMDGCSFQQVLEKKLSLFLS